MSTLLTLPTELLIQILTLVSSSKSDLYHLLQASKKLLPLIKPLLYHSITITDRATRHLLENVNEEDSKRVRKLVIRGHDNLDPYTIGIDDEDDSAPYDEDKVGQGCFRDLLEGNLLDLSCEFKRVGAHSSAVSLIGSRIVAGIETLHISNLREELKWIRWKPSPLVCKTASNLVELSVSSHTGTHDLWTHFLQPEFIPNLRRIGFCYVTEFLPRLRGYTSPEDGEPHPYPQVRPVELPRRFPYNQFDILALHHSLKFSFAHSFPRAVPLPLPRSKTLLIIGPDDIDDLSKLFKTYPNVRFPDWYEHPLNLQEFQTSSSIGNLKFLSLPSLHGKELSVEGKEWIEEFERKGGIVRWDGERDWSESSSCIPKHFVDYLDGMKRLRVAEETASR